MNYSFLKRLYEYLPYAVKAPFAEILRKKLINNKIFIKHFSYLQNINSLTDDDIQNEQLKLLKRTLIYAYENTIYYNEVFKKISFNPYDFSEINELQKLPVLTREMVRENFNQIQSKDIKGYLVTTGGSSGEPLEIMMSNEAYYIEWAFVYNYWSKFGYDIYKSRIVTFRGIKLGKKLFEINPMYNEIRMNVFLLNRNNFDQYYKAINKYNAEFIYGYPSAIHTFCKIAQKKGINLEHKFKAVFLISENLYPFQEKLLKEVLDCPLAMFYGHSERAVFAEKSRVGYRFNPFYGVTEMSENGEPVVTGFINKRTPLIRYVVDDKIREINNDNNPVEDYRGYRLIKWDKDYAIQGHHDGEVLVGVNGEEISAASINFHDKTFKGISDYQFIQRKKGECELCVVPNKEISDEDLSRIKKAVMRKMGNSIQCEVKVVNQRILTDRGKYKMIIKEKEFQKNDTVYYKV